MVDWIVCRPKFDEATQHSHQIGQVIRDLFKEHGLSDVDLAQEDARRPPLVQKLGQHPDANFCFCNHGDATGLVQQGGQGYVIDKSNDELLAGRIVYAVVACLWGSDGGIDTWNKGAEEVWCCIDVVSFTTDCLAEFTEFFVAGLKRRLEGYPPKQSLAYARETGYRLAGELGAAGNYLASVLMRRDTDILRCYNGEPPDTSTCLGRRLAIKIFGPERAWKLPSFTSRRA